MTPSAFGQHTQDWCAQHINDLVVDEVMRWLDDIKLRVGGLKTSWYGVSVGCRSIDIYMKRSVSSIPSVTCNVV